MLSCFSFLGSSKLQNISAPHLPRLQISIIWGLKNKYLRIYFLGRSIMKYSTQRWIFYKQIIRLVCSLTGVPQITETHPWNAVPMATAVTGTRLWYVYTIQTKRRHVLLGAALLDPSESGLTVGKNSTCVSCTNISYQSTEIQNSSEKLKRYIFIWKPCSLDWTLNLQKRLSQIFLKISWYFLHHKCLNIRRISDKKILMARNIAFFFLAYFKRIFGNLWNHQIGCTLLGQIRGLWLCHLHDSGRKESSLYCLLCSHLLPSLPASLLILKSSRCLFYTLSNHLGCQKTLVTANKQKRDLVPVLQSLEHQWPGYCPVLFPP